MTGAAKAQRRPARIGKAVQFVATMARALPLRDGVCAHRHLRTLPERLRALCGYESCARNQKCDEGFAEGGRFHGAGSLPRLHGLGHQTIESPIETLTKL
ncbi:hypothetical protein IP69_04670 [Bosea sp. AAP35]|nr:hypothetical protein IP69_04670 [Bosea sp. AAP35]